MNQSHKRRYQTWGTGRLTLSPVCLQSTTSSADTDHRTAEVVRLELHQFIDVLDVRPT